MGRLTEESRKRPKSFGSANIFGPKRFFTGKRIAGGEERLRRAEASRNRAVGRAERNLERRNKNGNYEGPPGIRAAERGR